MIEALPEEQAAAPLIARRSVARRRQLSLKVSGALYALGVVVIGVIAGWIWHAMVQLPTYLTSDDGSVQITERAHGQVFATDAVFVMLGLLVGVGLGTAAWWLFRRIGWPVAFIAVAGGLVSAGVCWLVGVLQGPRDFPARVAAAMPGDKVPIDFELHTMSAVFVWALGAIIPVMLYANLSREDEPKASRPGKVRETSADQLDETFRGELDGKPATSA